MKIPYLLGQPLTVLGHLHSGKVFSAVPKELPVFQFVPIVSGSIHQFKGNELYRKVMEEEKNTN